MCLHISRNGIDFVSIFLSSGLGLFKEFSVATLVPADRTNFICFFFLFFSLVSLFAHGACRVRLRIDATKIGSIFVDHKMAKFSGINVKFIGNF